MTLEELVGERLVIGVPGAIVTPEIVRHFRETRAGGLILYRINFVSPRQIRKFISDLEGALERKLLVTADHEGGRVIMFRDGITVFPDALAFGTAGNVSAARRQGSIEARELRRLGIDVNLAPVLDVLTESYSPNIGIRSFGSDPKLVGEMGAARISAMQAGGLSACAKHFPGKGHAPLDAHLALPVILSTWKEMEAVHLKPFLRAIHAGVDAIMSSHPYYPNLDAGEKSIATFSRKIIHDTLRTRLGYRGVISSDDLEMGAVREICPVGEAAVRAAKAGHDLLLVCHDMAAQKEACRSLLAAARDKVLPLRELEESAERIAALKAKRRDRFEKGPLRPEPAGAALAGKVARGSVTLQRPGPLPRRKELKREKVLIIFPDLSELAEKIMVEKDEAGVPRFLKRESARFGLRPRIWVTAVENQPEEAARAGAEAAKADWTILFLWDAHLLPGNRKLLDAVQGSAKRLVVATLRDPYDAEFVREGTACLTAFGWRSCQVRAVLGKILS
ncbi:MAG: hypothetical protein A2902_06595 [Elusimicrobia bacterium RIFCSPLOWO2_01_FULL_64_13]|nr:MAG: hypothetical protein A2636_03030 [Elusimicrobia bacterium RIFCSPHIGHO2_01_FULL_64_10]OGR97615.1 MAG: hypothetical protein A2902_06595 [Elusimicrobia bacterium RIFCSPLOWO2_01_FULL_64_13]